MTDREMLELAAKAAWIVIVAPVERHITQAMHYEGGFIVRNKQGGDSCWNPLTDDGDALRLAVKTGEPFVVRSRCVTTMGGLMEDFDPAVSGDDLRATRRAIVRAAAEIGRYKP